MQTINLIPWREKQYTQRIILLWITLALLLLCSLILTHCINRINLKKIQATQFTLNSSSQKKNQLISILKKQPQWILQLPHIQQRLYSHHQQQKKFISLYQFCISAIPQFVKLRSISLSQSALILQASALNNHSIEKLYNTLQTNHQLKETTLSQLEQISSSMNNETDYRFTLSATLSKNIQTT